MLGGAERVQQGLLDLCPRERALGPACLPGETVLFSLQTWRSTWQEVDWGRSERHLGFNVSPVGGSALPDRTESSLRLSVFELS